MRGCCSHGIRDALPITRRVKASGLKCRCRDAHGRKFAGFFELPVFTVPQREPEPMGYENAVREFDEIIQALRLRDVPREPEFIPEFKM